MKGTNLAVIALMALAAISLYNLASSAEPHHMVMFRVWMEQNGKEYDRAEKEYRMGVWLKNWAAVQEHNARYQLGQETYDLEMNKFADLTLEEFGAKYLMKPDVYENLKNTNSCKGAQPPSDVPDSIDWQAKGAVTPIKNQGQCGSCWAFSATGSLEGANFLATSELKSFSQQQLVDCSHDYGNNGCMGGLMDNAFFYVIDHGITLQSQYSYKGKKGTCQYDESTDKAWQIKDCTDITADVEAALLAGVAQQPVSVAVQANQLGFQLYRSGVFSGRCGTRLDHGVLVVGYGEMNGKNYYKVKNSWGATWGSKGYIYIERTGDGKGKCGIQMVTSIPIA